MKSHLIEQYTNIRDTIGKNVDTINLMLKQAESLSKIAESLSGETSADIKKDLKIQIEKMKIAISDLINQTGELFKLYDKFAEELFR